MNRLRTPAIAGLLLVSVSALAGCAGNRPPEIGYDADVPPLPPAPIPTVERPRTLHVPPSWSPSHGGSPAASATGRIANANAAARVEPRREGYYNAIQVYPWSEGALYQIYAAPGQITDLALEPGEDLSGSGPIAAGDTARWIIGDTVSGSGTSRRVHVLLKPIQPGIETNLVITTDRRTYMLELRSGAKPYMPSVAWTYPGRAGLRTAVPARAVQPAVPAVRNYRYALQGSNPPWRPVSVFDDGRHVYVVFPRGVVQGEMPPLFVVGPRGETQIVNSRVRQNVLIVDRLFAAAELRLGEGRRQQVVRIVRTDRKTAARKPRTSGAYHADADPRRAR
ncbi:MAG: P-type conjugative transfer protein TrbG [Amaricoccus sp.]